MDRTKLLDARLGGTPPDKVLLRGGQVPARGVVVHVLELRLGQRAFQKRAAGLTGYHAGIRIPAPALANELRDKWSCACVMSGDQWGILLIAGDNAANDPGRGGLGEDGLGRGARNEDGANAPPRPRWRRRS